MRVRMGMRTMTLGRAGREERWKGVGTSGLGARSRWMRGVGGWRRRRVRGREGGSLRRGEEKRGEERRGEERSLSLSLRLARADGLRLLFLSLRFNWLGPPNSHRATRDR